MSKPLRRNDPNYLEERERAIAARQIIAIQKKHKRDLARAATKAAKEVAAAAVGTTDEKHSKAVDAAVEPSSAPPAKAGVVLSLPIIESKTGGDDGTDTDGGGGTETDGTIPYHPRKEGTDGGGTDADDNASLAGDVLVEEFEAYCVPPPSPTAASSSAASAAVEAPPITTTEASEKVQKAKAKKIKKRAREVMERVSYALASSEAGCRIPLTWTVFMWNRAVEQVVDRMRSVAVRGGKLGDKSDIPRDVPSRAPHVSGNAIMAMRVAIELVLKEMTSNALFAQSSYTDLSRFSTLLPGVSLWEKNKRLSQFSVPSFATACTEIVPRLFAPKITPSMLEAYTGMESTDLSGKPAVKEAALKVLHAREFVRHKKMYAASVANGLVNQHVYLGLQLDEIPKGKFEPITEEAYRNDPFSGQHHFEDCELETNKAAHTCSCYRSKFLYNVGSNEDLNANAVSKLELLVTRDDKSNDVSKIELKDPSENPRVLKWFDIVTGQLGHVLDTSRMKHLPETGKRSILAQCGVLKPSRDVFTHMDAVAYKLLDGSDPNSLASMAFACLLLRSDKRDKKTGDLKLRTLNHHDVIWACGKMGLKLPLGLTFGAPGHSDHDDDDKEYIPPKKSEKKKKDESAPAATTAAAAAAPPATEDDTDDSDSDDDDGATEDEDGNVLEDNDDETEGEGEEEEGPARKKTKRSARNSSQ